MLDKNHFVAQIRAESLLLDLLLPIPDSFVVNYSESMQPNGSCNSRAILRYEKNYKRIPEASELDSLKMLIGHAR